MLSQTARKFLVRYVDSAELLDILMVLLRWPNETWTADKLSTKIFTVPQAAQKRLDELVDRGLARVRTDNPGAYELVFPDAETRDTLESIRQTYESNRADVVNIVFGLKKDPLASFSNAFNFRGDK